MSEYKEKAISLNKNRKLINAVKAAGLETFNPQGKYNGYGFEKLPLAVRIKSLGEMRKFNKILKAVQDSEQNAKPAKALTFEEKTKKWARRLSKLGGITFEEAFEIAQEKLDYHYEKINELEDRQAEQYSKKRQILIKKKYRENPLRYIKDSWHAENILAASERHNRTDYDFYLGYIHQLEEEGLINKGQAKELARQLLDGKLTIAELDQLARNWEL